MRRRMCVPCHSACHLLSTPQKKKKKVSVLIICIDDHPHHHQQVLRASYEPSQRLQIQKKLNTVLATETLMGWFISKLNIISKLQDLVRANKMT